MHVPRATPEILIQCVCAQTQRSAFLIRALDDLALMLSGAHFEKPDSGAERPPHAPKFLHLAGGRLPAPLAGLTLARDGGRLWGTWWAPRARAPGACPPPRPRATALGGAARRPAGVAVPVPTLGEGGRERRSGKQKGGEGIGRTFWGVSVKAETIELC